MKVTINIDCKSIKELHNRLKEVVTDVKITIKKEEITKNGGDLSAHKYQAYLYTDYLFDNNEDVIINMWKGSFWKMNQKKK
jgi:hypothetical protein